MKLLQSLVGACGYTTGNNTMTWHCMNGIHTQKDTVPLSVFLVILDRDLEGFVWRLDMRPLYTEER